MSTKTHGQGWHPVRNVKLEISSRKFRNQTNRSFAILQPRRRKRVERLPMALVGLLQTLTLNESGPIVFAAKEEVAFYPSVAKS
jgi:hypothetical protein